MSTATLEDVLEEEEDVDLLDQLEDPELVGLGDDEPLTEDAKEFIHWLTIKTLTFLHALCADPEEERVAAGEHCLYPYEYVFAYRIIESVILNDGAELTALFARQSGKTQTVAACIATIMLLFPRLAKRYPTWLGQFRRGVKVGCFAPVEEQAQTLFARIVQFLTSDQAVELMAEPDIQEDVDAGGKLLTLTNCGSFVRLQTAHERANIESKTYDIILVDEAQRADRKVVRKSIHPMGASTNATIIKTGTPDYEKGDFYEAIRTNKRKMAKRGARQDHFEANWREVVKYNPRYKKFIAKEITRIGEESDEFQLSYCVAPETRILTADLRYIRADEVRPGMQLVGFDEDRPMKGAHRKFRSTSVEDVGIIRRPAYRVTLSDGTVVTSSSEHQWLVSTAGRRTVWRTTASLCTTDRIFKVADVWDEQRTFETGYLAAALDGEGHLALTPDRRLCTLTFSQKTNGMLSLVRKYLDEAGFQTWEHTDPDSQVTMLSLSGGRAASMRFLGSIRPVRLLDKFSVEQLGSIGRHDHVGQQFEHPQVVSTEFVGEIDVVAIRTDCRTYVAEGLASHNCLKWLLERGMFTTEEKFDTLGDRKMKVIQAWRKSPLLAGLDVARRQDSTVATVIWVDWDNPDEQGLYDHRVLNWLEIHGDNWEEQYAQVFDFFAPYDIVQLGVDGQGMGDLFADRMSRLMPNTDVLALGSTIQEQSKRWKHLTQLMQRNLISWPAHPDVRRTQKYKRFKTQMLDAERQYKGGNMVVAAPDENDAHDDYVDSLGLGVWLTKEISMPEVEVSENMFYERSRRYA